MVTQYETRPALLSTKDGPTRSRFHLVPVIQILARRHSQAFANMSQMSSDIPIEVFRAIHDRLDRVAGLRLLPAAFASFAMYHSAPPGCYDGPGPYTGKGDDEYDVGVSDREDQEYDWNSNQHGSPFEYNFDNHQSTRGST